MGIFDRFRHHKDDAAATGGTALKDRATEMMSGMGEQMGQGLDKAGQMINDRTGGKYSDQITTGVGKAKDMINRQSEQAPGQMDDATAANPMSAPDTGGMGTMGEMRPETGEGTTTPPPQG
jgi:hypothetical protein